MPHNLDIESLLIYQPNRWIETIKKYKMKQTICKEDRIEMVILLSMLVMVVVIAGSVIAGNTDIAAMPEIYLM